MSFFTWTRTGRIWIVQRLRTRRCVKAILVVVGMFMADRVLEAATGPLIPGTTIQLGTRTATVRRLDTLPYVESEYTRRFRFDSHENPKLAELRTRYKLEEVIAPGKD